MSGSELSSLSRDTTDPIQKEAVSNILDAKIAQEGLSEEVERARNILRESGDSLADYEDGLKGLVIDYNKSNKAAKALCETIEDNSDALKEGNK
jgi:hypothetical protein